MSWFKQLTRRMAMLVRGGQFDREMDEEMRLHRELKEQALVLAGMPAEEARYAAQRQFGNALRLREESRAAWGWLWLEQLGQDVRFALRMLRKNPAFTTVAILTLALGIGANSAIFTLVHAVLLDSLPVSKPGELYRVGDSERCCVQGGLQIDWSLFSYDQYKEFRDKTSGFAELAAFQAGNPLTGVRRTGSSQAVEPQRTELVSGNYFAMLGISAFAGRTFTAQDDHKGAEPVVVMSYRAWRENYGGDPSVVGATFVMDGQPFTVIGIAAPGFFGDRLGGYHAEPPAFWIPISDEPLIAGPYSVLDFPQQTWLDLIGRIAPGADPKQIEAQMQVELKQWLFSPAAKLEPGDRDLIAKQTLHLSPGGAGVQILRRDYQSGLHLLMWISAMVLIVACTNVAGLALVHATTHRLQSSIRTALGASVSRHVRRVLTESIVLAVVGGVAGVVLAFLATRVILHLAFHTSYVAIPASPSLPVLAFTFGVSLLTGIFFGVAPAWLTASAAAADALRGASRSTERGSGWAQKSLVITQIALSLVLLSTAGLLIQSLRNMRAQKFGFETPNRYIVHISPQMAKYKPDQLSALYTQLHGSITAIPGVSQVSFSIYSPLEGDNWSETIFIEGQAPLPPLHSGQNNASWLRVSADYFETLGIKIVQGRPFTDQDSSTSQRVAIVNQTFAQKFFKDNGAIGKHFGFLQKGAGAFQIVGVAEDTLYANPAKKAPPMFFLAATQSTTYDDPPFIALENASHYLDAMEFRTVGAVPGLESQVRHTIADINPSLAVIDFMPFAAQVENNFNQQSMIATLTSLFGFLALALAAIGLYGVTAYSVERRTKEIGIRMALGAGRFSILKLVLRGTVLQVVVALTIGILVTIGVERTIAAQLFGIKQYNPTILLIAIAALTCASLLASHIPARRATRIDPAAALRNE